MSFLQLLRTTILFQTSPLTTRINSQSSNLSSFPHSLILNNASYFCGSSINLFVSHLTISGMSTSASVISTPSFILHLLHSPLHLNLPVLQYIPNHNLTDQEKGIEARNSMLSLKVNNSPQKVFSKNLAQPFVVKPMERKRKVAMKYKSNEY